MGYRKGSDIKLASTPLSFNRTLEVPQQNRQWTEVWNLTEEGASNTTDARLSILVCSYET
jgi:hypothetical protein